MCLACARAGVLDAAHANEGLQAVAAQPLHATAGHLALHLSQCNNPLTAKAQLRTSKHAAAAPAKASTMKQVHDTALAPPGAVHDDLCLAGARAGVGDAAHTREGLEAVAVQPLHSAAGHLALHLSPHSLVAQASLRAQGECRLCL